MMGRWIGFTALCVVGAFLHGAAFWYPPLWPANDRYVDWLYKRKPF